MRNQSQVLKFYGNRYGSLIIVGETASINQTALLLPASYH